MLRRQTYELAVKNIGKSWKSSCIMIMILFFLFFMTQLIVSVYFGVAIEKWTVERKMGQKISEWGMLRFTLDNTWSSEWQESVEDFFQELLQEGVVERIGSHGSFGMQDEALLPLLEIQNASPAKTSLLDDNADDFVYAFYTWDKYLFDYKWMQNEDLMESIEAEDMILLLGSSYKKIKDGTILESAVDENRRYIVAGHFPPDYAFFSEMKLQSDFFCLGNMVAMDDMVVIILPEDDYLVFGEYYFYCPEGVTPQTMEEMEKRARAHGIDVTLMNLKTRFERSRRSIEAQNAYTIPFFFLMFFAALLMILSHNLIDLIQNRRKYGIYHTVGMTNGDIVSILFWESVVRSVPAMILSGSLYWIYYRTLFGRTVMDEAMFMAAFLATLLMAGIVLAVTVAVPYAFISKKAVNELLRAER